MPLERAPAVQLYADAGGKGLGPANSLAACRASVGAGADYLSLDLRLDPTLGAVLDGPGTAEPLSALYDEFGASTNLHLRLGRLGSGSSIRLINAIGEATRQASLEGRVVVSSKSVSTLAQARTRIAVPLALGLKGGGLESIRRFIAPWLGCCAFHVPIGELEGEAVRKAHLRGYGIVATDVNSRQELGRAVACGVNGLVTSDPATARKWLEELPKAT